MNFLSILMHFTRVSWLQALPQQLSQGSLATTIGPTEETESVLCFQALSTTMNKSPSQTTVTLEHQVHDAIVYLETSILQYHQQTKSMGHWQGKVLRKQRIVVIVQRINPDGYQISWVEEL